MFPFAVTLATCSLTMAALAVVYMAVSPLLSKRYSARGRYYAWLIVVIGFVVPFRPQFGNAIVKVNLPETTAPIIQIGNGVPRLISANAGAPIPIIPAVSWWQIAMMIWLVGAVAFLTYQIVRHNRFVRMANRWSDAVTDRPTLNLLSEAKAKLGITRKVGLYRCSCIGSPMMMGFTSPRILLTTKNLAEDELALILRHELIHYRRKDLWYKALVLLATSVHWFNPVVHLMARSINVLCEVSCDAEVVRSTDVSIRQQYSEAIIGVIQYQSKMYSSLSTTFIGGKKGMKSRMLSIMDTGKKKAGLAIIGCALIVTLGVGFAFTANAGTEGPQATGSPVDVNTENRTELFSKYAQYGLSYDLSTDRLYYNGVLVRYFDDPYWLDANSYVTNAFSKQDGAIDVHGVRNASGELTGVTVYSQEEFDAHTEEMKNPAPMSAMTTPEPDAKPVTRNQDFSDLYAPYKEVGITYDPITDNLYYDGKLIRFFQDDNTVANQDGTGRDGTIISHYPNENGGEIDVYTVRDANQELTGITIASQSVFDERTAILDIQNDPSLNHPTTVGQ